MVRAEARRLEHDLYLVRPEGAPPRTVVHAQASIDRARRAADRRQGVLKWWSGELVEEAWTNLQAAKESIILLQDDGVLRAQLPALRSMAIELPHGADNVAQIEGFRAGQPLDRAVIREVVREHDLSVTKAFDGVRWFRNLILLVTALLVVGLGITSGFVHTNLREVMGLGALTGILATVVMLVGLPISLGPYGIAGAQALLKIPAGAATAFLAVILLRHGFGGLEPAVGTIALFYAVIFGFAQQILTDLVDRRASSIVSQVTDSARSLELQRP